MPEVSHAPSQGMLPDAAGIETHLPLLSRSQFAGLVLWVCGTIQAGSACQTELDVSLCFAPLLRWVLSWWYSDRLAMAVDPALKGEETTAIVISVVYRSCAIPVAWPILRANKRGAWMDPIVELLQALAPAVPEDMTVIVLCDRGLTSPKLWEQTGQFGSRNKHKHVAVLDRRVLRRR